MIDNPWVVGIGCGFLSGALVAWITHLFLARGEKKEYSQKVAGANRDVIYAIRPGIPEGQIPSREVVTALINSTARRYSVSSSDLYGPREIAEELVKEVMDTSFLASTKKTEYCHQLASLQAHLFPEVVNMKGKPEAESSDALAKYRQKTAQMISVLLGVITAMVSGILMFQARSVGSESEFFASPFVLTAMSAIMILGTALGVFFTFSRPSQARPVSAPHNAEQARAPRGESPSEVGVSKPK